MKKSISWIQIKHRYSRRVNSEDQHNSWQQSSEDFDHLKEIGFRQYQALSDFIVFTVNDSSAY